MSLVKDGALLVTLLAENVDPARSTGSACAEATAPAEAAIVWERRGPWLQLFTPRQFSWGRAELPVPNLPAELEGLKIVHLTDLHFRWYWSHWYERAVERVAAAQPDLVLLTGDFVDHKHDHRPGLAVVERFVSRLKGRLGTFAVLGNHDGSLIGAHLRDWGVTLMGGRVAQVTSGSATVELIGLPGCDRDEFDAGFIRRMPAKKDESVRIVLTHYPDWSRKARALAADLILAGHTHGGQVCLPNGRPMLTHDSLPKEMSHGVHRIGESWLVVGRGFGFSGLPIRAFCPAEILELVLRRG